MLTRSNKRIREYFGLSANDTGIKMYGKFTNVYNMFEIVILNH